MNIMGMAEWLYLSHVVEVGEGVGNTKRVKTNVTNHATVELEQV